LDAIPERSVCEVSGVLASTGAASAAADGRGASGARGTLSNVVAAARRFGAEATTWTRRRGLDNGLATGPSGLADTSSPVVS